MNTKMNASVSSVFSVVSNSHHSVSSVFSVGNYSVFSVLSVVYKKKEINNGR